MLNQRQSDTLHSNTVQNLKNNGNYFDITTQSGLSTMYHPLHTEMPKNDKTMVNETPIMDSNKETGVNANVGKDTGKGKVDEPTVRQIP